jgi:hypothetical protein
MAKTNLFPLYLDADAVAVTADDATYTVTSSRVTLNGTASCDITLDDATEIGTVVHFEAVTSIANPPTVQATTGFSETITLDTVGDAAICMWTDSGWRIIGNFGCTIA